jgi:acyl-coenzyme A thioesterase PaaI-like protein
MCCNFIGAAKGDELVCEGRVLKRGRSTFFSEARLFDGVNGPLLASGQGAYKFLD